MMLHAGTNLTMEDCLNPGAMRTLLQAALPDCADGNCTIETLRVVKARRNASRQRNSNPLTVCYEVDVRDRITGGQARRQYYGKVYRDGASALAVHNTPALHLAPLDMLLWAWPEDPGLPQLPHLLGQRSTQALWGESTYDVCALRYEPECRATLRYTRITLDKMEQQLYAKTFNDDRGEAIYRRFTYFWELAQHDSDAPLVAQPLSYCNLTRSVWQARANGRPLLHALTAMANPALAPRLACAIAALHAAPLELAGPTVRDSAYWLHEISLRRNKIARVAPHLADRLTRVTDLLARAAENLPGYQSTLIHGDFHPEQVWLDGERIVLFDFDEVCLGDPMEDLAEFVTKLELGGADSPFAQLLMTAYAQRVPERFDPQRLQWHLAVQQLLQASRAFIFQIPDWHHQLERRLARTEILCELMNSECVA